MLTSTANTRMVGSLFSKLAIISGPAVPGIYHGMPDVCPVFVGLSVTLVTRQLWRLLTLVFSSRPVIYERSYQQNCREVSSDEKDMARIASVAGELVPGGTDRWNKQSTEFDTTIQ